MAQRYCEVLEKAVTVVNKPPSAIETDDCAETRFVLRKLSGMEEPEDAAFGCQSANVCEKNDCLWCPRVQRDIARMEERGFECGAMAEFWVLSGITPAKEHYIAHMVRAGAYHDYAPKRIGLLSKLFGRKR